MTVAFSHQQQAETVAAVRTQEEELVEGLRTEFHETACKIQSLQAETESLRTLVRNDGFSVGVFSVNSTHLLRGTFLSWDAELRMNPIFHQILFPEILDISGLLLIEMVLQVYHLWQPGFKFPCLVHSYSISPRYPGSVVLDNVKNICTLWKYFNFCNGNT